MRPVLRILARYAPCAALLLLVLTVGCGGTPVPCDADIVVTKTADTNDGVCSGADCSLREAVIRANACAGTQTILVPAGTYTLTRAGADEDAADTGDLDITDSVAIWGTSPAVIDGDAADRVFQVNYPAQVEMNGLIIQNGQSKNGAGILNDGSLTLTDVVIRRNAAVTPSGSSGLSHGGGILSQGYGALFIRSSEISGNSADQGGGIVVIANLANLDDPAWNGPGFSIRDSLVSENVADDFGGGMALESTFPFSGEILRTRVADNRSGSYGSGIYNNAILGLYQSVVHGNRGGAEGGGVYSTPLGNLSTNEDLFEENEARFTGGGIYNRGQASIFHSAFVGNTVDQGVGAAIYNEGTDAAMVVSNSTFSGNRALIGGAGLANADGDVRINFSTITLNDPEGLRHTGGGGISVEASVLSDNVGGNCGATAPISIGYSIDSGNTCALLAAGDMADTDPQLEGLAMNGGLTPTHALKPGSPAIDSAVSAVWCFSTDQRGVARPQGAGCDRGAFELEKSNARPTPTPTLTRTPMVRPTPTFTPTPIDLQFIDPWVSTDHVYYNGAECGPQQIQFQIGLSNPEIASGVGIFFQLQDKSSGALTSWSPGFAMSPVGEGKYFFTLLAEDLPGYNSYVEAWLRYQFVANDKDGNPIARSEVFANVTLSRCGTPRTNRP